MSGNKRRPDRELNHENWDQEDEPVEQGVFQQASAETISKRRILKASRKIPQDESRPAANPFSSIAFSFGAPITASSTPPVVAPADSITSATSDDSNSGEVVMRTVSEDGNNEVDSSSTLPTPNVTPTSGTGNIDGQGTASSSSGSEEPINMIEAINTNGAMLQSATAAEEASSEADACSTDSSPEKRSRYSTHQDDDEIASSSNNADNEDSSNDNYYSGEASGREAEAEDSNEVEQDPADDSKIPQDIDSTVQEQK